MIVGAEWLDKTMTNLNDFSCAGHRFVPATADGRVPLRTGNRELGCAPQGIYPSLDGRWVAVTVVSDDWLPHAYVGSQRYPRPPVIFTFGDLAAGPAPTFGQHNHAVLHDVGFDDAAIAALGRQGVIATELVE